MTNSTYHPSRPAPTPPCWPRPCDELPVDHPFLNPYFPSQHLNHAASCSSLDSVYTIETPPVTPTRPPRSARAYTTSPATGSYPSSLGRCSRSPSSWLAAPLSPSGSTYSAPKHTYISQPKPYHPTASSSPSSPTFIPLPTELSLFDTRPRNLLADLEFIAGKKLHFPFLQRRKGQEKEVKVKAEKEKKRVNSEKGSPTRLTKERRMSEEQEYLFEAVIIRGEAEKAKLSSRRGRGVREGNWI